MEKEIGAMIQEAVFLEEAPKEEARLKEDLGFDSLSIVQFIVELEEMLGMEFEESDLEPQEIETVGDIYKLVGKYAGESGNAV